MESEELLTVSEAAKHAGVSRQTIYNWITGGLLKPVEEVGRVRVRKSELDAVPRPVVGRPAVRAVTETSGGRSIEGAAG